MNYIFSFYHDTNTTFYRNWWHRLLDRKSTRTNIERVVVHFTDGRMPDQLSHRLDDPMARILFAAGRVNPRLFQLEAGEPATPYSADAGERVNNLSHISDFSPVTWRKD
jgi:hypothetical protein